MSSNQLYANGRISVLSTKMLGQDKFLRLAECLTLVEALKVLGENGYGNGVTVANPNDYEQILRAELDQAMSELKELCFDQSAVSYLLCPYDYVNAKVLMKSKYTRTDGLEYCFEHASYNPSAMQTDFVNDSYGAYSNNMAHACDAIDAEYANGNRSPQIVDMILDKACFQDMRAYAKKSSISLVRKMFDWQVNTTNLMLVYRLKKAGLDKVALATWFVDGASIKQSMIAKLWDSDSVALDLPEEYRRFYALCKSDNATLSKAEAEQTSYLGQILRDNADLLTIQPVLEYFYKKTEEIQKVRHVLVDVKNGVDKDRIKEKLK